MPDALLSLSPPATFAPRNAMRGLVPVRIDSPLATHSPQPLAFGVPLPQGQLLESETATLLLDRQQIPLQTTALAHWPDRSIKWLLLEGITGPLAAGTHAGHVDFDASAETQLPRITGHHDDTGAELSTGPCCFVFDRSHRNFVCHLTADNQPVADLSLQLSTHPQRSHRIVWESLKVDGRDLRRAVLLRGVVLGCRGLAVELRISLFAGTGLFRCDVTIHNQRRARHRGGLWDLGDPGSWQIHDLSLRLRLHRPWEDALLSLGDGCEHQFTSGDNAQLVQYSSGGENWRSDNHVDRTGNVPLLQPGFTLTAQGSVQHGKRATPHLQLSLGDRLLAVGVPEFWQQFPKALSVTSTEVRIGLFPHEFGSPIELQGGERKRHTVWLACSDAQMPQPLTWVHHPAQVAATRSWQMASGVWPASLGQLLARDERLESMMVGAVVGPHSFEAKREAIDEYGWRHYGDVWADHEGAYYTGKSPVISHYNNQYDLLWGMLIQHLRSGVHAWWQAADALARHVVDIDIYHTASDKAAFNGGMFWHTSHYHTAATATHRTYSRQNRQPGRAYGGGPSAEHNYATGLLYYHYLTGDPAHREAVIQLAEWTIAMDDGRRTSWSWLDSGPTGHASRTYEDDYHGPGRGAANSLQTLLCAWELTRERKYLQFAETLIRRCIHPRDDIAARNLLDAERRWSYSMFLVALDRYLDTKVQEQEIDDHYAYAQHALLAYVCWMLEHERPYLDHPEQLEFVTETWAVQDIRKANVLLLAMADAPAALADRLRAKAEELAEAAWQAFLSFSSTHVTRAVALLAIEGTRWAELRAQSRRRPRAPEMNFGAPTTFVPSTQVKNLLKSPRGWQSLAGRFATSLIHRLCQGGGSR